VVLLLEQSGSVLPESHRVRVVEQSVCPARSSARVMATPNAVLVTPVGTSPNTTLTPPTPASERAISTVLG
jgi:hypothetical protein